MFASLLVEGAERLVHQQHRRGERQRPAQRDALRLAAAEADGSAMQQMPEVQPAREVVDLAANLVMGPDKLRLQALRLIADHQPQSQAGSALENMRCELPDSDSGVDVGSSEGQDKFMQSEQCVGALASLQNCELVDERGYNH